MKKTFLLSFCLAVGLMAAADDFINQSPVLSNYDQTLVYQLTESGYMDAPLMTPAGIILTNNRSSEIYLLRDGVMERIVAGPGCGRYVHLNADASVLGFKRINEYGLQAPAIINLNTLQTTQLEPFAYQCGQISFANGNQMAYSIEHDIVVVKDGERREYNIGYHTNIVNITPDASAVLYSNFDGNPMLLDVETGVHTQLSDVGDMYINTISPDGTKAVCERANAQLYVFDLMRHEMHFLGNGFGAVWLDDEHLAYTTSLYANNDVFAYEGSEVCVSRFDGSQKQVVVPASMECPQQIGRVDDHTLLIPYSNGDRRLVMVDIHHPEAETVLYRLPDGVQFGYVPDAYLPVDAEMLKTPSMLTAGISGTLGAYDIPYIQQSWDVPTSYAGCYGYGSAACAPCTGVMLMAYYGIIGIWSKPDCALSRAASLCTWGASSTGQFSATYRQNGAQYYDEATGWGRYNPYAPYVGLEYTYNGTTFSLVATKNSCSCKGACGWMWNSANGGSPSGGGMGSYYKKMGVQSAVYNWGDGLSKMRSECAANYPYSWCITSSRSNGHLILPFLVDAQCDKGSETHGKGQVCTMTALTGSIVCNDPAGNANNSTWRSDGRHATYDYSGYNNGYLTMVNAWGVCVHHTKKSADVVHVTGITLNHTLAVLKVGKTVTLTPTFQPVYASDQTVTWSSSNTKVASVSGGVVTAVAAGEAVITVKTKDGGFTATCNITVLEPSDGDCNIYGWTSKGEMCLALQEDLNALNIKTLNFAKRGDDGDIYYHIEDKWLQWEEAEKGAYSTDVKDFIQYVTYLDPSHNPYKPEWVQTFIADNIKWNWLKNYIETVMPSTTYAYDAAVWRAAISGFFLRSPENSSYPKTCSFVVKGKDRSYLSAWDDTFCPKQTSDVEAVDTSASTSRKVLIDGQIFILRDGHTYNVLGSEVR